MLSAIITITTDTFIVLQKYKKLFNVARKLFYAIIFLYIINVNPKNSTYTIIE